MKEKMPLTNIDFKSLVKDHFSQNPNEEQLAIGAAVLHLGFVTILSGSEQYDIKAALGSVGGALVQSVESSGLKQYESKNDIHQFLAPLHQKCKHYAWFISEAIINLILIIDVKEPLSDNDGFYVSEDIAQGNSTLLAVRDGNDGYAVGIDSGVLAALRVGGGDNRDMTLAKVFNVYNSEIEDMINL